MPQTSAHSLIYYVGYSHAYSYALAQCCSHWQCFPAITTSILLLLHDACLLQLRSVPHPFVTSCLPAKPSSTLLLTKQRSLIKTTPRLALYPATSPAPLIPNVTHITLSLQLFQTLCRPHSCLRAPTLTPTALLTSMTCHQFSRLTNHKSA